MEKNISSHISWSYQVFIGKNDLVDRPVGHGESWKREFLIVELIIHYKYNSSKNVKGTIKIRKDYDIALIRIDYPIIDEESG